MRLLLLAVPLLESKRKKHVETFVLCSTCLEASVYLVTEKVTKATTGCLKIFIFEKIFNFLSELEIFFLQNPRLQLRGVL